MSQKHAFIASFATILAGFLTAATNAQPATAPTTAAAQPTDGKQPPKIYELRIYVTNPGKLPDLHARFREHTMKLFEKHGMENVIYWTLTEDFRTETKVNTLVYLLAHKNKEAADASWQSFRADPEWQAVVAKSEENGRLTASPPVSIYMNPTDFHPGEWAVNAKSDKPARLFELRTYNDGEARVPATVGRFRDWEAQMFRDSGMETLGFWTKADNSAFVYLLGHKDRETADKNWPTFFAAFNGRGRNSNPNPNPPNPEVPEQAAAAQEPGQTATPAATPATTQEGTPNRAAGGERQGRRTGRGGRGGGIERRWLVPTDYSPRK